MKKICWLKDSYKATWKIKKIQRKKSYQATKLLSYQSINVFQEKKSYRATELLSSRHKKISGGRKATKLPAWKLFFFFHRQKCYLATKQLQVQKNFPEEKSYQATKLLSYRVTGAGINFRQKKSYQATELSYWATKLPSYRATKLLSYRHEKIFWNFFSEKLLSYRATELPIYWANGMKIIFFLPPAKKLSSYQATTSAKKFSRRKKLPSYQATKLPSYRRRNKFPAEKKLPGYWAELLSY